jgi:predicted flap endonuclease-1-like 5' DNA nuclease
MRDRITRHTKKRGGAAMNIIDVEGIGPVYADKLAAVGVKTVESLLDWGATPKGRKDIATRTGIDESRILKWVNMADLYRIKGIGSEYSELLEAAGVDTVVELSKRVGANLSVKMAEINAEKKLVRKVPTQTQVEDWVAQAKTLKRIVSY